LWETLEGARSTSSGLTGLEPDVRPLTSPEEYNSGDVEKFSSMSGFQVHIREALVPLDRKDTRLWPRAQSRIHHMKKGIGIDFGTTNSSVALARADHSIHAVSFQTTSGTTETYRSVLYFEPRVTGVGGPIAIERYLAADEKGRLIQSLKSFLASRLFTGTSVFGKQFTLEDLITIMLRDIRFSRRTRSGRSMDLSRLAVPSVIRMPTVKRTINLRSSG
jgi:hypothetical protein